MIVKRFMLISSTIQITEYIRAVLSKQRCENTENWLLKLFFSFKLPFTVIKEKYHVDRYYRDSYYMHFSGLHFESDRFCDRLSFFDGELSERQLYAQSIDSLEERLIGTCVLKPLAINRIGRSLIKLDKIIKKIDDELYFRTKIYKVTIQGIRFRIKAFPYSMQDLETNVCAGVTLLNLMDYFSHSYPDYKIALPSKMNAIKEEVSFERTLPSKGMNFMTMSKILTKLGFFPRLYGIEAYLKSRNNAYSVRELNRIVYYYIESGIPIALGIKQNLGNGPEHAVACIGHKKGNIDDCEITQYYSEKGEKYNIINSADFCKVYVIMNDQALPYQICSLDKITEGMRLANVLVPLYKKMYLEATDAYEIAVKTFTSRTLGIRKWSKSKINNDDIIITRLFLTSSRKYKDFKVRNLSSSSHNLKSVYAQVPLPKFIWVCELTLKDAYKQKKSVGEIVIDATASAKRSFGALLMIRYFQIITFRNPTSSLEEMLDLLAENEFKNDKRQSYLLPAYENINLNGRFIP